MRHILTSLALPVTAVLGGCLPGAGSTTTTPAAAPVWAPFTDLRGEQVGTVSATDVAHGTLLRVTLRGLAPGAHGIHVHAVGRCEPRAARPFSTAGGHLNPRERRHGLDAADGPHAGDLPNLLVPSGGDVTAEFVVSGVRLGALQDADGASVVVHAAADDHRTDPAGGSGERVACAVVAPAR